MLGLAFLVSLLSFSGFARSPKLEKNSPTELVDAKNKHSLNVLSVDFYINIGIQNEYLEQNELIFKESLDFIATSYSIKYNIQTESFLNSITFYLILKYHLKSDESDNNFIG